MKRLDSVATLPRFNLRVSTYLMKRKRSSLASSLFQLPLHKDPLTALILPNEALAIPYINPKSTSTVKEPQNQWFW